MKQLSLIGKDEKTFWECLVSGKFANMVREEARGNELNGPDIVYNVMKPIFAREPDIEKMFCIFLDGRNRVISIDEMSAGTINQSAVYPREILKRALKHQAAGIVLSHNHPSGNVEPSVQDKDITLKVGLSVAVNDIHIHDHIIVGDGYYSFSEMGLMQPIKERVKEFMQTLN